MGGSGVSVGDRNPVGDGVAKGAGLSVMVGPSEIRGEGVGEAAGAGSTVADDKTGGVRDGVGSVKPGDVGGTSVSLPVGVMGPTPGGAQAERDSSSRHRPRIVPPLRLSLGWFMLCLLYKHSKAAAEGQTLLGAHVHASFPGESAGYKGKGRIHAVTPHPFLPSVYDSTLSAEGCFGKSLAPVAVTFPRLRCCNKLTWNTEGV